MESLSLRKITHMVGLNKMLQVFKQKEQIMSCDWTVTVLTEVTAASMFIVTAEPEKSNQKCKVWCLNTVESIHLEKPAAHWGNKDLASKLANKIKLDTVFTGERAAARVEL